VTESEVLSLVRGEMRRVLGEVVCGMDAHDVIDAAQIGVGIRALSAPASPPVEPQPAATGLEMPKPFAHVDDTHDEDARRFTGLCLRSLTASQGDPIYHAEQVERLLSEANAAIAAAEARGAAAQKAKDVAICERIQREDAECPETAQHCADAIREAEKG
jgi:hypothetical protein